MRALVHRSRLIFLSLLAAATLAGCASKGPATHYYLLEVERAVVADASATSVGVASFQVDPPYDDDRVVYRVDADSREIGFYAYHRWAAPLSRMLPTVAADALSRAGGPRFVPVEPGGRYPLLLTGRVESIEEIDIADAQRIRVRMTLGLRTDDGTEVWSKRFERTAEIRTDSVARVVEEMNDLLRAVFDGAHGEIVTAIHRSGAAG